MTRSSSNGDAIKAADARKRGRWDQTIDEQFVPAKKPAPGSATPTWADIDVRNYFTLHGIAFYSIFFCVIENTR